MAVGAVSVNASVQSPPPLQQAPAVTAATAKDKDGDEATETAAEKAREAASGGNPLPVDTNRGRNLNITV